MSKVTYESAGVNITAGNEAVARIKDKVKKTFSKAILTDLGSFGALIDLQPILQDYKHPVLVQSIDGVGTKTIIAKLMKRYDTLGFDLLSATCNDIVVLGAKPITFLDYIANDQLDSAIVEELVTGMVNACCENDVSLVGGETAEMPNVYLPGEHDLVGVITGVVEKDKAITGEKIQIGDVVIGLASSGMHTNGYSLARKIFFELSGFSVHDTCPGLVKTVGETLLEPHINYTRPILAALKQGCEVHGMAHITGGGLLENVPRILPANCTAQIDKKSWPMLPVFQVMQKLGELDDSEAYRTLNMGIGLVMVVPQKTVAQLLEVFNPFPFIKMYTIGRIIKGDGRVKLTG